MSWTCECTESNYFKVANPEEVKKVLERFEFSVYESEGSLIFYGEEGAYLDSDCEVVLSIRPVKVNDTVTNFLGLSNSDYHSSYDDVEELMKNLGLTEKDVMVQNICEYLQDQLTEDSYILITNAGFDGRSGGSFEPFGSVEIITKTVIDKYSLYSLSEQLKEKYVKKV